MNESSSAFIVPTDFSSEWRDITLVAERAHAVIYTATRYGRRFVLKALPPEYADLTDYRSQQEQEFQMGVQLVHPNIAASYSLEQVDGVGRCIVQEWINGVTLCKWLQTKPTKAARERVFGQLMDALEYLHGIQLVHHDLKADNILITRNGANVKLIDFGLSATDATLSPVPNDPRTDIQALQRLFPSFVPCGQFANIAALRSAIRRRKRIVRMLPVIFSFLLLSVAVAFFYLSWHERYANQQRFAEMTTLVDYCIAHERAQLEELANRPVSFDSNDADDMTAYRNYINEHTVLRQQQWVIRDSIMATYPEDDPLREQFFQYWSRKESDLDKEIYPRLTDKLKDPNRP